VRTNRLHRPLAFQFRRAPPSATLPPLRRALHLLGRIEQLSGAAASPTVTSVCAELSRVEATIDNSLSLLSSISAGKCYRFGAPPSGHQISYVQVAFACGKMTETSQAVASFGGHSGLIVDKRLVGPLRLEVASRDFSVDLALSTSAVGWIILRHDLA